jgi:hypothetical protein
LFASLHTYCSEKTFVKKRDREAGLLYGPTAGSLKALSLSLSLLGTPGPPDNLIMQKWKTQL